jgi:hypothetical protein
MKAGKLIQRVIPVAGELIDNGRLEQPNLIVMPQHTNRNPCQRCKLTNPQHIKALISFDLL